MGRFFGDLEAHLRALMVVQTLGGGAGRVAMTAEADARLLEQARRSPPASVTHVLDLLADGLRAMKDGADARTQLELALVKAADPARDASQKALLARAGAPRARPGTGGRRRPRRSTRPSGPPPPAGQAPAPPRPPHAGRGRRRRPCRSAAPAAVAAVAVAPVDGVGELRELWPAVLEQLPERPRQ